MTGSEIERNPYGRVASVIDSIGNAVLVSGLDIREAGYALQPGRYPIDVMPALLHEAAHFDTFQTPVGHALAALYLRAWVRAVRSERDDGEDLGADHYEGLVDFIRYEVATEVLRPLAEGLALFTEFDSIPLSSPVTTSQSIIAGTMCYGEADPSKITIGELAFYTLAAARRRPFYQARKENLLTQPLTTKNGGYLPGYLLVKGVRNLLLQYNGIDKLRDGDLFFYCVKSVVFGDLKLARILLDPELDLMFSTSPESIKRDAVNATLMRIQDRIITLFKKLDSNYVERLERIVGAKEPWSWLQLQIDANDTELREDAAVFGREIETLIEPDAQPTELARKLSKTCNQIMRNRDLLCIASFDTIVRVTPEGRCVVGSALFGETEYPVMALSALKGSPAGSSQGTYEIYLDQRKRIICFSITQGNTVVACGSLSEGKFDVDDFVDRSPSMRSMTKIRLQMEADLGVAYFNQQEYQHVVSHYTTQLPSLIDNIYMNQVKAIFEVVYAGKIDQRMETTGIIGMGESDLSIISDYSLLSIVYGGGPFTAEVFVEVCKALSFDATNVRAELKNWHTRTGFPLVHEVGERVFFTA